MAFLLLFTGSAAASYPFAFDFASASAKTENAKVISFSMRSCAIENNGNWQKLFYRHFAPE